jgi:flavin reductase (DIM6/NTAB) family NADH-FMN oxidoreductase RutF
VWRAASGSAAFSHPEGNVDPAAIANVFGQTDPELWLVTAAAPGGRGGLIATFVNAASIVPEMPRVLVGLARQHHTWGLVEAAGAFALHLLAEDQVEWVWRFGLGSGRDADKLAGLPLRAGVTGAPVLTEAPAFLDCRVEARLDTGDRTVYLAEVADGAVVRPVPVLTLRRAVELAPAERLRQLKEALARDAAVDAEAIRQWRQARARPDP